MQKMFDIDVDGERFIGRHDAVPQHVGRDVEHVLRDDIVAAAQRSERSSGGDEAIAIFNAVLPAAVLGVAFPLVRLSQHR